MVTPYTVTVSGLLLAVAALHPFGLPLYMNKIAQRSRTGTYIAYLVALAAAVFAVHGLLRHQPGALWYSFPAIGYWFLLTDPGRGGRAMPKAGNPKDAEGKHA